MHHGRTGGPRDSVLSIYGNVVREFGGWIAVADLLELLETLGMTQTASRAAISRMKGKNELRSETRRGRKGYSLTPDAEEWFRDGTDRILSAAPAPASTSWVLASFSVPENDRRARYKIRARLGALGFGQVSAGLMMAPSALCDETKRALVRAGLEEYVALWNADHVGFASAASVVAKAWDLPMIADAYGDFLGIAEALLAQAQPETDKEAFVDYMGAIGAWRELPFLDPGLPTTLLPSDWPAPMALAAVGEIISRFRPAAVRYAHAVMAIDE